MSNEEAIQLSPGIPDGAATIDGRPPLGPDGQEMDGNVSPLFSKRIAGKYRYAPGDQPGKRAGGSVLGTFYSVEENDRRSTSGRE